MKRCLYCYQLLTLNENDLHAACSKKIFDQATVPELNYTEEEMKTLGTEMIRDHEALTGVQPKLSVGIIKDRVSAKSGKRFSIGNQLGGFIIKQPHPQYPFLPEVEDLTMHLASLAKIKVVPHSLIRLASSNLAYITKRIDRKDKEKLHMEDMCQLTERITEDKYHGYYEQVAKTILKYSSNPGLDLVNFFEQVLFCFLTGNADMHLKNFSLIQEPGNGFLLSPAYDMVSTALVNPADDEDLALTLNGKKKKIKRADFEAAFRTLKLDVKQQVNIFQKMERAKDSWWKCIESSFLDEEYKSRYREIIEVKWKRVL